MIRRIIAGSRFIIFLPIIGLAASSLFLFVFGVVRAYQIIVSVLAEGFNPKSIKAFAVLEIEVVDLFLLGTAFYIMALGFYELFIDEDLPIPTWISFHNFDELKSSLLGVIIVLISVLFTGQVVTWDGGFDLIASGASIALVIAALTYYLSLKKKTPS